MNTDGLLKMSELAERSGVSAGTIKHYLREGLLDGESVVRTSRNMAWYRPELVERVKLVKRLQEERFMPLKLIRGVLGSDPERARALIELEDRILEHATAAAQAGARISAAEARRRFDVPRNVLDRLAELDVLSPTRRGYDADDVAIIKAISRLRAGGHVEALGFTVYDTLRYREALAPLVEEEVRTLLERLAGEVEPERAVEIVASGAEPLRALIGALHSKLLAAELRRHGAGPLSRPAPLASAAAGGVALQREEQLLGAPDVAHVLQLEAELRQHAPRSAVRLARDRHETLHAERAEGLRDDGGAGLRRVPAPPVRAAEGVAQRDVGPVGRQGEQPRLADQQAALALEHRPERVARVLLLGDRALERGARARQVAGSAEQSHRGLVAVQDGVQRVQVGRLVGAQREASGEDRQRHRPRW